MAGKGKGKTTVTVQPVTPEELIAEFVKYREETDKRISKVEAVNAELRATNKALGEELKKKPATNQPVESVKKEKEVKLVTPTQHLKHDGKEYRFTCPKVRVLGDVLFASAILENPELYEDAIKDLVKKAPGAIIEV